MENVYLFFVIVLFVLAITDLVVGVSNDAVNFLNSAIGSQVASKKVIFIVAGIGVFVGATFSSGMMEIARKGIFNPEFFYFSDIMIIFLAVMITDIILLDVFNTFGMPTSTTVSIVFELLGAAVIVSIIKLVQQGESIALLNDYINTSKALAIISGIVLSVAVAFSVGVVVQYLSRLLFSFNYTNRLRFIGSIWAGFALTALSYFLIFKGMKGASFVSDDFLAYVTGNTLMLVGISFVFWTILMQLIVSITGWNILRFVVLFGTFALAMAFAGNDLVNFIGVPIAGFESYMKWSGTGVAPNEFSMAFLKEPIKTDTYLLVLAGAIMVITLVTSKKAQSVTETEVNLGRQNDGVERFSPNYVSRILVLGFIKVVSFIEKIVPVKFRDILESNFKPLKQHTVGYTPPAFDMVRASVNLTTASVLIAFATSLKLPLSTTYVSFMVAMGTSLSDRAWDRESAVFRISGVFSVIGGWFVTAIVAFTISAIFAVLIYQFELTGVIVLVAIAFIAIARNFIAHRKKEKKKLLPTLFPMDEKLSENDAYHEQEHLIKLTLEAVDKGYLRAISGLIEENRNSLALADKNLSVLKVDYQNLRLNGHRILKNIKFNRQEKGRIFIDMLDCTQDLVQSVEFVTKECSNHVLNSHKPLTSDQVNALEELLASFSNHIKRLENYIESGVSSLPITNGILKKIAELKLEHIDRIQQEDISGKNSNLYFSLLLETEDLIQDSIRLVRLLNDSSDKKEAPLEIKKG